MAQQVEKCKNHLKSLEECESGRIYLDAVSPNGHSSTILKISIVLSVLCTVIVLVCATYVVRTESARYQEVLELKRRCHCATKEKSFGPLQSPFPETGTDLKREILDKLAGFRSSKDGQKMDSQQALDEIAPQDTAEASHPTSARERDNESGHPIDHVILKHYLARSKRATGDGTSKKKKPRRRRRPRSSGRRRHRRHQPLAWMFRADSTKIQQLNPNPGIIYKDWKQDTAFNSTGISYNGNTGKVKIETAGLYFIYATVAFFNPQARSTYTIYVSSESSENDVKDVKFIQCTQSVSYENSRLTAADNSRLKSCSVAAPKFLNINDEVYLKQEDNNKVFFKEENTFFGLVKLS